MLDLESIRSDAASGLDQAMIDLREASRTLVHDDPQGAVELARIVMLLDAAARRAPVVTARGRHPASDTGEGWILAAGRLHDALCDVYGEVGRLWRAALHATLDVPVPEAGRVQPDDRAMFGHAPEGETWVSPWDSAYVEGLAPLTDPAARRRRFAIVEASRIWCRDHHAAEVRSGFRPLQACSMAVFPAILALRAGMVGVTAATPEGLRVKARAACQGLVEVGDDPSDLSALVRDFVAGKRADDLDALAWSTVGDLLTPEERR